MATDLTKIKAMSLELSNLFVTIRPFFKDRALNQVLTACANNLIFLHHHLPHILQDSLTQANHAASPGPNHD